MISLIIVANGLSKRFGKNKMLVKIGDEFLIKKTIRKFLSFEKINQIILVANQEIFEVINLESIEKIFGGSTRSDSVRKGLAVVKNNYVIVHDGARPFVSKTLINNLINNLKPNIGVVPVLKVTNCLKKISNNKIITVNRDEFVLSQTPQAFDTKILKNAFEKFNENWFDESQAVEENGGEIIFINGETENFKITFKEDIEQVVKK